MKVCLFAGTFDPITIGHYSIIKNLLEKFDKVVVAIGVNPDKTPIFSLEDRLSFLRCAFKDLKEIEIDYYQGITVEYMQKKGIKVLARGIRNQKDLAFEKENEKKSKNIYPDLQTEYFLANQDTSNISSTLVRERLKNNQDISNLVPRECSEKIKSAWQKLENK